MTAWQLWVWLHEVIQGIPAWTETWTKKGYHVVDGHHYDYQLPDQAPEEEHPIKHDLCYRDFMLFLAERRKLPFEHDGEKSPVPEAARVLFYRARAAWNGEDGHP